MQNLDAPNGIWSPHRAQFLDVFCQNFFWTCPHFLNSAQVAVLLDWAREVEEEGLLKNAAIGKGEKKETNQDIRSDKIHWLEDFSGTAGSLVKEVYDGLLVLAKRGLFLPAKRFECHFAQYEAGDFYLRHSDRHSFLPGRLITCVIYLSELQPGQGGELVVYDEDLKPIKITPQPGRIVVFDSGLEHEVKKSKGVRWSLTGWIREDLHPGLRI